MKRTMRWFIWVAALCCGAVLGIALAGVEDDTGMAPEEAIRLLSDPDWTVRSRATRTLREGGEDAYKALFKVENPHPEARFRIALLKKELAPLYGSWKHALEAGREAFDAGRMSQALSYFLIAARKNEPLRTDAWLADLCVRAWEGLSESARNRDGRLDWQLYLCGEFEHLVNRFPESPLREKALFRAGRYEDVVEHYPEGTYAPLAKYSLTAGHSYYEPPRYLEIKDPEGETREWPRFLREHPGHPGCDDASYRMGRALEHLSRYREAVVWLMRSARLPDGEFTWKGPLRAVYVLDARATEVELKALSGKGHAGGIREKAHLTLGVRALRKGAFGAAREVFRAFLLTYPDGEYREKVEERIRDLDGVLIPNAERLGEGAEGRAGALYTLGRYFYHRVLSLYNPIWEGNRVNYFSYEVNCLGRTHAFQNPEYFESHNNFLRAAHYFDRLWREHPDSIQRPDALYSAGTAYFRAVSLNQFSIFRRTRKEILEESGARYRRLIADHPQSPLAGDAARMIRVLGNTPKDTWR